MPWGRVLTLIAPHYPKGGWPPMPLERHGLSEAIFAEVNAHLADKGITLRSGTLADVSRRRPSFRASLRKNFDAPSSTRRRRPRTIRAPAILG